MKTFKDRNKTKGFTLIELMIVIAIIGVLTTVAVPMYQDYTVRSKVAASMSAINSVKFIAAETFARQGTFPDAGNKNYGLPAKETYADNLISSIDVLASGAIQVVYKKLGEHFGESDSATFTPTITGGMLRWSCLLSNADIQSYFPSNCKKELPIEESPKEVLDETESTDS